MSSLIPDLGPGIGNTVQNVLDINVSKFNKQEERKKLLNNLSIANISHSTAHTSSHKGKKKGSLSRIAHCFSIFFGINNKNRKEVEKAEKAVSKVNKTLLNIENKKNETAHKGNLSAEGVYHLPNEMFSKDLKVKVKDKELMASTAYSKSDLFDKVGNIVINSAEDPNKQIKLKPWGYDPLTQTMVSGRVIPTSALSTSESEGHLVNCYSSVTEGRVLIRSGVIDTKNKAADWLEVCKNAHETLIKLKPDKANQPMRLVSHQLNSQEISEENAMINNQHRLMLALNQENPHAAQIAHINTPLNRGYHWTKFVLKFGLIGKFIVEKFLVGEKRSHEQNIEGLGTYNKWVVEDILKFVNQFTHSKNEEKIAKFFEIEEKALENEMHTLAEAPSKAQQILGHEQHFAECNLRLQTIQAQQKIVSKLLDIKALEFRDTGAHADKIDKLHAEIEAQIQKMNEAHEVHAMPFDRKVFLGKAESVRNKIIDCETLDINDLNHSMVKITDLQEKIAKVVYRLGEIDHALKGANKNEKRLSANKRKAERELKNLRTELKRVLIANSNRLARLDNHINAGYLDENFPELKDLHRTITLFKMFLATQLELPNGKMNRGQEIMVKELLNHQLDAISAKNCKSGLDRTGIEDAIEKAIELIMAVDKKDAQTKNLMFYVVTHWDHLTREMNRQMTTPKDFIKFMKNLNHQPHNEIEAVKQEIYKFVNRLRNNVLHNLIESGIEITGRSTGVEGFKWHKEWYQENLIPQNFIPSFVTTTDGNNTKLIQLLRYDRRTGRSTELTEAGHQLLTKHMFERGS